MARIIVAGYIARFPLGGQAWAHLQYLLGLRALGHEVWFFEDAGWHDACYNPEGGVMSDDPSYGVRMLGDSLGRFGLGTQWVYRAMDRAYYGLSKTQARVRIAGADLLFNLSGVTWFEGFERIPHRLFVDEDPAFTQVRAAADPDFADLLRTHQMLLTYGHNVGQRDCTMPVTAASRGAQLQAQLDWTPFQQPIALDQWTAQGDAPDAPFTTILSWNAYGEVTHGGRLYGAKSRSFPTVMCLPHHTRQSLELAVSGDGIPRAELEAHGWQVRDPLAVSRTLDSYRAYIRNSRGEFSVAKHGYVVSHSGWFSDRSAAYLASGRPVILQDTGYRDWLPAGEGLLPFTTLDEASDALDAVNGDYGRHRRAARAIAEQYFDARRVLGDLLRHV